MALQARALPGSPFLRRPVLAIFLVDFVDLSCIEMEGPNEKTVQPRKADGKVEN